jgi:ribosomal protein L29
MTDEIKHARDMTPGEREAKLAELKRGAPPPPVTLPEKHARELTESERSEWLREHKRRFQ